MILRRLAAAALLAGLVGSLAWNSLQRDAVGVAPGEDVSSAARRNSVIRLLPGTHGPFTVARPGVVVEGAPGAVAQGPITVTADDVTIRGLVVRGGESGITVRDARGVLLEDIQVTGARLHGVEVVGASATIRGCTIDGLRSAYAQGVEVRNASGNGRTVIQGCTISGGQEGLVTHSARAEFLDNVVTSTTLRAIAITEMSEGIIGGNHVSGALGIGLFCGDMSHCEIRGNTVRDVRPDEGVKSRAGYAVVGWYYSTLRVHGNDLDRPAVHVGRGSVLTDRFPPSIWAPGWTGVLPGFAVATVSLVGLAAVRAAVSPWMRRIRRRREALRSPESRTDATTVLLAGFAVQSFHMVEHVIQVIQVYVLDAEVRSGLAGRAVDTEWVHFIYNAVVLGFMVWLWRRIRPGSGDVLAARASSWAPWVLAATLIQGYHLVEHTAKMVQHLALGIRTAPGLIGDDLGLVWFHFGINLAVYAGLALPMVALLARRLRDRRSIDPRLGRAAPEGV